MTADTTPTTATAITSTADILPSTPPRVERTVHNENQPADNFMVEFADEGPFHHDNLEAIHAVEHHLHPLQFDVESNVSSQEAGPNDEENNNDHCIHDIDMDLDEEEKSHYTPSKNMSWQDLKKVNPFTAIKHVLSLVLTLFCIVVVTAAIFKKQTTATGVQNVHPILAFVAFWGLLLCLALMEGGLNCMVGLKPIEKTKFSETHKRTLHCTTVAHRGNNLERFIVGRQYLDLMVVFLTSFMVSAVTDASVLGLPKILNDIFLASGLAVILVTIIFGQLIDQINAAHSMLDYMNNYAMIVITYLALLVEASGILHAVYLAQIFFSKLAGKPIESNEPPKTMWQRTWFWLRVAMSVSILIIAFAVSLTALFQGKTKLWEGVPPVVSLLLLIGLIGFTGLMEGLQIALFAVVHLPAEQIERHPIAKHNCDILFHQSSLNLQAFLVGRQIFQTVVMFLIARITTVNLQEGQDNLFGVSDGMQNFLNTGVLGALLSTIVASLSWRVLASSFPMAFLANPLSTLIIRFCLCVEWTGICYSAWFFAYIHQRLVGYRPDEVYIGPEVRHKTTAAAEHGTSSACSGGTEREEDGLDPSREEDGLESIPY